MSLTRLGYLMRRPALRLVLLLVLVGQSYAATHDHTHAGHFLEASECMVCHVSASIDDVHTDSSRCAIDDCRTHEFVPVQPNWPGFDPCQIANARAPPAC